MGALSPTHWLIIAAVMLLLFGAKRLPETARGIGRSARILKAEMHEVVEPAAVTPPAPAAVVPPQVPVEPVRPSSAAVVEG